MSKSFSSIMDILVLFCGAYCIYTAVLMIKTRELQKGLLISKDIDLKKIKDKEGYINFIGKKTIIFGTLIILYAGVNLFSAYVFPLGFLLIINYTVFLIVLICFAIVMKKAHRDYLNYKF